MFVAGMQHCRRIQRAFDFDGGTSPGDAPGHSITSNEDVLPEMKLYIFPQLLNEKYQDQDFESKSKSNFLMVFINVELMVEIDQNLWRKVPHQLYTWIENHPKLSWLSTAGNFIKYFMIFVKEKVGQHRHTFQQRTKVKIIEKRFVTFPGCKYLQADCKPDPEWSN